MSTEMAVARRSRASVYLRLGRVSNLPTIWTNCLAGTILAGGDVGAASMAPLLAALSLFYTGGMFLNDAFDAAYDRELRPERPIPSGEIATRTVFTIGFGLLAAGEALLALPSLVEGRAPDVETMAWGVVLAGAIVYYDFRHKRDRASPVVMALCRAAVYLVAASAASTAFQPSVAAGAGVLASYLIGLTYVAKQENLSEVRNLWPLLFLVAPIVVAPQLRTASDPARLLYLLFWCWCVYAVSHLIGRKRNIPRAVVSLIAGISLLDGVLIAAAGAPAWGWVAAAGFLLTLVLQRYVPGT